MMTTRLMRLADLRQVLLQMERDFGLGELSDTETKLLYAAAIQAQNKPEVSLSELQEHLMTQGMSRSTFFRSLRHLVEIGYLQKVGTEKRAGYRVVI
jgi:predicted transcriptional regulator